MVLATLAAVAAGCAAGRPAQAVAVCPEPRPAPVSSGTLGLAAFVGTDGRVYVWEAGAEGSAEVARPLHEPDEGWSVQALALSPAPSRPYLAVAEAFDQGSGAATRLVVVDTRTTVTWKALPNSGFTPDISLLQWSRDGRRLFAGGSLPLVLDVDAGTSEVTWDLSAMAPPGSGTEARRPLLAPDFSVAAFTRHYLSGGLGEDLWTLGRDESAPSRRTAGNLGAYPVAWLGGAADGSELGGPYDFLLVQVGASSTGNGSPRGLAVVNVKTGEIEPLGRRGGENAGTEEYPDACGDCCVPLLVDLGKSRVLVHCFHVTAAREARTYWVTLDDGTWVPVTGLDGLRVTAAVEVAGEPGLTVLLAHGAGEAGSEIWVLDGAGNARRAAAIGERWDTHLVGSVPGRVLLLGVDRGGGRPAGLAATFLVFDTTAAVLTDVLLTAAAEADGHGGP
ncbi:MAG: hypothetical protein C4551_03600 [Bacillota bacterium]|nr:MAG: hypothetical protein C4551_03600 [Bacillota bacterium]